MPTGRQKSRSSRRVFKRSPSGENKLHYVKRKPKKAVCGGCGQVLSGTLRKSVPKMKKMPKTSKRPSRPFGGVLCSPCLRKKMISEARGKK